MIHEGVDVEEAKPSPHAKLRLPSGRILTKADEVVTFVARNFEPVRGFHIFMRALPRILTGHPRAQIVFVGGEGNPYGALPPDGQTWRTLFLNEIADRVDKSHAFISLGIFRMQTTSARCKYLRPMSISPIRLFSLGPSSKR